jgi:hypothetical protein
MSSDFPWENSLQCCNHLWTRLLRRKKSQIHDLKGICSNWLLSCALSMSEKMLIVGAFLYYCGQGRGLLVWWYMLGKYIFHDLKTISLACACVPQTKFLHLDQINISSSKHSLFSNSKFFSELSIYLSTYWFKVSFWF